MTEMQKYIIVFLAAVFVAAAAQILLKKSAMHKYSSFIDEYLNPLVIFAYILFFGATVVDVFCYKVIPLSLGPILEATSYIYVTIFGALFFKERITPQKIGALLVIIAGIAVFTLWG